jgi:hypothetical protein
MEKERFVAVWELKDGGLRLESNLDLKEAEKVISSKPAVFARMPPCSYGVLEIRIKNKAKKKPPKFVFDFKLSNAMEVAGNDDRKSFSEAFSTDSGSDAVECPENSGQLHFIDCPAGQHGVCQDGTVGCAPLLAN